MLTHKSPSPRTTTANDSVRKGSERILSSPQGTRNGHFQPHNSQGSAQGPPGSSLPFSSASATATINTSTPSSVLRSTAARQHRQSPRLHSQMISQAVPAGPFISPSSRATSPQEWWSIFNDSFLCALPSQKEIYAELAKGIEVFPLDSIWRKDGWLLRLWLAYVHYQW